jgi:hypothetical protein
MAKTVVTTTEYTDDIDGSKAEGTVAFAFEGLNYEIDLSKSNTRAFEKAMAPYVGHARKARSARGRRTARSANNGRDAAAIRAWATENGYEVSTRGRVPAPVVEAYNAAQ